MSDPKMDAFCNEMDSVVEKLNLEETSSYTLFCIILSDEGSQLFAHGPVSVQTLYNLEVNVVQKFVRNFFQEHPDMALAYLMAARDHEGMGKTTH